MTTSTTERAEGASVRRRPTPAFASGVALLLVVGFCVGVAFQHSRTDLGWMHERATLGSRVVSIEYDGWTYGARDSIPTWRDEEGTWHSGGWPSCLRGTGSSWVRFQAVEVGVEDSVLRPIVAVDCQ